MAMLDPARRVSNSARTLFVGCCWSFYFLLVCVCLIIFVFVFVLLFFYFFFFFQAEDGIRDWSVTGVHTCALPISIARAEDRAGDEHFEQNLSPFLPFPNSFDRSVHLGTHFSFLASALVTERQLHLLFSEEIGRASCRERVYSLVGLVSLKIKLSLE